MLPLLLACLHPPTPEAPRLGPPGGDPAQVAEVAALLAGSYSSAAQAAGDAEYKNIALHIAPIWPARAGEHWLYVEQAVAGMEDRPYRVRVYEVRQGPQDTVESVVYELPGDPLQLVGAWREPARLEALGPGQLVKRPGCSVLLREESDGAYVGGTLGKECLSDHRGAAYATSKVRLDQSGLSSWDQGFDAADQQVWGATRGPYVFLRGPQP